MKTPISTVDTIIRHEDKIVLIRRGYEPFAGMYALPGGHHDLGETLENAAIREAEEETGLIVKLTNPGRPWTYSNPERDPRGHVISHVYDALSLSGKLEAKSDAKSVHLKSLQELKQMLNQSLFAFDHERIVSDYLTREGML